MNCTTKGNVLIVPEGIVRIGFRDICNYFADGAIEEVILPSTLKVIENDAFFDFSELKKINIPDSVIEIGSQAFWGLDHVEDLIVSDTVELVGKHAFCNLSRCTLTIVGQAQSVPEGWDEEFAFNVKEIRFASHR